MDDGSKVLKCDQFRWRGINLQAYRPGAGGDDFRGVSRQAILGYGGGEEQLNSVTRYFEIEPGGYSSLERHAHPHAVVVLRGTGQVILNDETHAIGPFDSVYVAPWALHQFQATGPEPLG